MTLSNEEITKKVQKALTLFAMSEKEKQVQIALGTLDIPELIPINLRKTDKNNNTHPDIKEDEQYLVRIYGEYLIGYVDPDDHTFCIGCYEETINDYEAIWLIKGRNSPSTN